MFSGYDLTMYRFRCRIFTNGRRRLSGWFQVVLRKMKFFGIPRTNDPFSLYLHFTQQNSVRHEYEKISIIGCALVIEVGFVIGIGFVIEHRTSRAEEL